MNFIGQGFRQLKHHRQTDRHTDRCDWKHYHAVFAGGNNGGYLQDRSAYWAPHRA